MCDYSDERIRNNDNTSPNTSYFIKRASQLSLVAWLGGWPLKFPPSPIRMPAIMVQVLKCWLSSVFYKVYTRGQAGARREVEIKSLHIHLGKEVTGRKS